jgi:hypothetical protein
VLFNASPIGNMVAVTLIAPGVVTAAVLFALTAIWTSTWSTAVKLGIVPLLVPVKLTTVVVALDVIVALLNATVLLFDASPAFAVSVNVTPVGTPLNVKRICVPLGTATPLLELCVAVRQAAAKPSVISNDAALSGIVLLVKIVAVPELPAGPLIGRPPTAIVPTPGEMALITVALVVVKM